MDGHDPGSTEGRERRIEGHLSAVTRRDEQFEVTRRAVRVLHDGEPAWGSRDGDEIVLDSGARLPEPAATYLAPATPSKIIAVHLTYRSRSRSTPRDSRRTRRTS